jgi:hypothetical protein
MVKGLIYLSFALTIMPNVKPARLYLLYNNSARLIGDDIE